ncbi:MAG: NUMOD3 domain-containing DNA-binding protein [Thermoplasmatales archaeon]
MTARIIKAPEKLEIYCNTCNSIGLVTANNANISWMTKGYSYCCHNCKKAKLSRHASKRVGENNHFYGKKHSNETKDKISHTKKESYIGKDTAAIQEHTIMMRAKAYEKYNGNPMHNAEVRAKHHEATHSEKFIEQAKINGLKRSSDESFSKTMSENSLNYWNEDREEKTQKQKQVFIDRVLSTDWTEKRQRGLKEYLSDPERVKKTWERVAKICIEKYGHANWQNSDSAAKASKSFSSKAELELLEWVQTFFPDAQKTRNIKEIDIFIPSLNIGIEYNGLFWHSELNKDADYHLNKTLLFREHGIRLIHVFEHLWRDRRAQVKSYLKSTFGQNKNRVGARKCELKEVNTSEARAFLDTYHIQGKTNKINLAVGLYYNNELLSLATFGLHHRNNRQVVLNRFVCKENWTVSGGLSRLTKYASDYFKEDIITWADNSLSEGNGYLKSGWELAEILPPDYFYTDGYVAIPKQNRKKSLVGTPKGMTEHDHALSDGLFRVYDCGKTRFIYKF